MSKLNLFIVAAVLIASSTGCGMFRSCSLFNRNPVPQPIYQPVYPAPVQQGCCGGQPGMMVQP